MKYKVAKPEDFTDTEGYEYKLAQAYSTVYSDLLMTLASIDSIADVMEDYKGDEIIVKHLRKITKKYK